MNLINVICIIKRIYFYIISIGRQHVLNIQEYQLLEDLFLLI